MLNFMIDVQALQTESRLRGIGRSLSEILEKIIYLNDEVRWHFLINSTLYTEVSSIINYYSKKNNKIIFHTVQTMPVSAFIMNENLVKNKISEFLYSTYVEYINPDIILIPSLFEGFIDDSVIKVDNIKNIKKAIIVHDFIPYLNQGVYFDGKPLNYKDFYINRLKQIDHMDLICVISDSVKNEVETVLPDYPGLIFKISSGVSSKFVKNSLIDTKSIFEKYNIKNPYMLYTGGYDERKNINNLLLAFSLFLKNFNANANLVLCGPINDYKKNEILSFCRQHNILENNIIITGYVDDDELINFYNLASLYVFPSWHEGFGLPVLEAIKCGTLVIASNLTSLPEVVGTPEALFDPFDIENISLLMGKYFSPSKEKNELLEKQYQNSLQFDWQNTAELILNAAHEVINSDGIIENNNWAQTIERLNNLDNQMIENIKNIKDFNLMPEKDLILLSNIISNNRNKAEKILRNLVLDSINKIIIEGPYDSNYSLAIVNRFLALEIKNIYKEVYLKSSDGPGDYEPSNEFLSSYPEIAKMQLPSHSKDKELDVLTRCMYPPRCNDMTGRLNALHCYAWEETGFPLTYVRQMNENLQLITVVSKHVKNILINNGVNVPIKVVGNGVDHYNDLVSKKINLPDAEFIFLHISSCFPRKGIDLLIKSYCEEFTNLDDVLLVIKTFKNPHNDIFKILNENIYGKINAPKVFIIEDDLDPNQINYLYEVSHCFVAPSRAEGFGLPFAEAKLKGLKLITTAWGGALDFCNNDEDILIDYDFGISSSHLNLYDSVWAEPKFNELKLAMRECFEKREHQDKYKLIQKNKKLLENYSWKSVSKKIYDFMNLNKNKNTTILPKVAFVSPINKRCGIATYSEHLINHMGGLVHVYADYHSKEQNSWPIKTKLCWNEGNDELKNLKSEIINDQIDIVVVQFNYGFYEFTSLSSFLAGLINLQKIVVVELHSTIDPENMPSKKLILLKDILTQCDRIIVHDVSDMNRLKTIGLVKNVVLVPHGILFDVGKNKVKELNQNKIKIASYGFFLPGKGLIELIEGFNIASNANDSIELFMYNAEYPIEASKNLITSAHQMIKDLDNNRIHLDTYFHSDADTFKKLEDCDIIIYPYQQSNESASGAVRYGLSSGALVLVSPLSVFDNVDSIVCRLSGFEPKLIANDILKYAQLLRDNSVSLQDLKNKQADWARAHSYSNIGYIYKNMLHSLFFNRGI